MYKKIMTGLLLLNLSVEAEAAYSDEDDFYAYLIEDESDNKQDSNYVSYAAAPANPAKNCTPCRKTEITPAWPYDTCGFVLSGDFLWWKVDEAGLDYAFSKNFPVLQFEVGSQPGSGLVGREHKGSFNWSPGFRVGLGCQFIDTPWTLQTEYTRFTSENTNKAHVPAYNGIQTYTTSNPPGVQTDLISTLNNTTSGYLGTSPEKARSHLNFKYNVVDLNLLKHLFSNSSFVLSPYFGAEGAFISQKWNVIYYAAPFIGDVPVTIAKEQRFKSKWDFKGGGLDIGVNIDWYWGAGFSFYANAEAAAYYGSYHHALSVKSIPAYIEIYQDVSEEEWRTVQKTQLSAGLEWAYAGDKQAFSLFAGWEFNTLYNLMENFRFAEATSSNLTGSADGNTHPTYSKPRAMDKSDIHLQGLTVGAKWLF